MGAHETANPAVNPDRENRSRDALSSFAGDVLKLASGTTVAQVVTIVSAPIIARLFSPEAFGVAAIFASFTSIISVIVCFRYELSMFLPKKDEDASNAMAASTLIVLLVTFFSAGLVLLLQGPLVSRLKTPELSRYLWLLPVGVLGNGLFLVLSGWTTRKQRFGRLTIVQILNCIFTVMTQILAGIAGWKTGGALIIGTIIGLALSTLFLTLQTWHEDSHLFLCTITWRRIWFCFKRYSNFPKYNIASSILNVLSFQSPTFFLAGFFSTSVVGQYSLGNRLLRAPMSLVGANISKVFLQRAARANSEGQLASLVEHALHYLILLSIFPCFLLALTGRDIFVVAFGQRWAEAGVYTQILSPWVFFWFISAPLNHVFTATEQQESELICQSLIFASRAIALFIGGLVGNPRVALALFSISGVLAYGYYSLAIIHKCGASVSRMALVLLHRVVWLVPSGLIIAFMRFFRAPAALVVLVSALLLGFYVLIRLREDLTVRRVLKLRYSDITR